MEAVNHGFYWSKSPLHPSDSLKAHVKGHQRRVPACRLTSSSAAGRLKRRDLIKSRRFYQTSCWTCADPLGKISTLRLRSSTQLEGKTENRIQCEKTPKKTHFHILHTPRQLMEHTWSLVWHVQHWYLLVETPLLLISCSRWRPS